MKKKMSFFILICTVTLLSVVFWMKNRTVVKVQISSYFKDSKILLASVSNNNPSWFEVTQEGPTPLKKGAYYFKLIMPEREKVGLIAVNDATPIVLK